MKAKSVKLFSTLTCPYCIMEKQWLDSKNVPHEVVYVDQNYDEAMYMVKSTGQMGVPVTEVITETNDKKFVVGFDTRQLSELIG